MSDKEQEDRFATYATTGSIIGTPIEIGVGTSAPSINLQLMHWKEAKKRYLEKRNDLSTEDMVYIVDHLTDSLSALFGSNYPGGSVKSTPQLKNLLDNHRSKSKIKLDRVLYKGFLDLTAFYDATVRHHDQSKRTKALELNRTTVERLLETTKQIWIWFGKTVYPDSMIPGNLLVEFKDDFYHFPE